MNVKFCFLSLLLSFVYLPGICQEDSDSLPLKNKFRINGFIRVGLYGDLHNNPPLPFISSGYSDLCLKVDNRLADNLRACADLRFRYGSEFHKSVRQIITKEAYIDYSIGKFNIIAGHKILKWGRADFTNPTSKLNPQNFVSRSTEKEDMDLGNILTDVRWFPSDKISIEAVAVPFYRASVLLIDPIPMPQNITVSQVNDLVTSEKLFSYGIRTDFHPAGIDLGISWFEGYDPMPGIAMDRFSADFTGPAPAISAGLKTKPYRTRMAGLDFETSAGDFSIRGEAAWTDPFLSYKTSEYVPMEEIKWVAGADYSTGNWRITGEYSGKFIPRFEPSATDPIIGTEPYYAILAQLLATPGFDLHNYIREETGSFNRLYNYQLKKWYHQAGVRIEGNLAYSRFLPSVFTLYNITTGDLMIVPEIRLKPMDTLTVVLGAEVWYGKKGSLFYLVKDYLTSIYAGIKVDF